MSPNNNFNSANVNNLYDRLHKNINSFLFVYLWNEFGKYKSALNSKNIY